jgi:phospholipase/carboxylesterase
MISRRELILGIPVSLVVACTKPAPPPPKEIAPRRVTYEGVDVIEIFTQSAGEHSPIIVAIHGMGDSPEPWAETWKRFPGRAHVVIPRAFDRYGPGWSWFEFKDGMTDEEFGAGVGAAEERLWKAIAKIAAGKKVIVTGFSQGGILSFAMASRHPDAIIKSFPVGGSCPGPLLPKNKSRAAPIVSFHGTTDPVLDIKWDREAVKAFAAEGNKAELREYEGVGHTITQQIREDVYAEIRKVLPA